MLRFFWGSKQIVTNVLAFVGLASLVDDFVIWVGFFRNFLSTYDELVRKPLKTLVVGLVPFELHIPDWSMDLMLVWSAWYCGYGIHYAVQGKWPPLIWKIVVFCLGPFVVPWQIFNEYFLEHVEGQSIATSRRFQKYQRSIESAKRSKAKVIETIDWINAHPEGRTEPYVLVREFSWEAAAKLDDALRQVSGLADDEFIFAAAKGAAQSIKEIRAMRRTRRKRFYGLVKYQIYFVALFFAALLINYQIRELGL